MHIFSLLSRRSSPDISPGRRRSVSLSHIKTEKIDKVEDRHVYHNGNFFRAYVNAWICNNNKLYLFDINVCI
jgi:hypothetical protein